MHDKRFGLKVMIGIVLGIGLGLALTLIVPVGVQPGDVLRATLSDGTYVNVKITTAADDPKGTEPSTATVVEAEERDDYPSYEIAFASPVTVIGKSLENAQAELSRSAGVTFESAEVTKRDKVVVRPGATEIVYIVGQIFIRMLKMLVIPLIIATVLIGIASLGNIKKLGRLGKQAALWYVGTMLVAVAIGVTYVNLINPGEPLIEAWSEDAGEIAIASMSPADMILKTIPTNPIDAIARGDIVAILFFIIIFALAMLKLGKRRVAPVFNFFEGLNDIIYMLIGWVLTMAPIGVGCLIAESIGTQDFGYLGIISKGLGLFALTLTLSLATHFIFLMIMVKTVGKYNPFTFLRHFSPALATAFGSSSSSATLPVTMTCVAKTGVSKRISNFVLPVGATLNMDGTALFEAIAVLFFAQAFGHSLGLGGQVTVALTSIVAAMGAAGIPSAGLVTMTVVLSAVGLPVTKISFLWAIDRPLDMMRTVVNITGDAVTARVIQTLNPDIKAEEDDLYERYEEVEPEAADDD
ncbi:MAG: dicarboxylate/amino acid:cation symporter [Armatimonadetes bacterium]|nr:dicarboxylate/amino acid:cation symporter [Armatimonadota bacterium]